MRLQLHHRPAPTVVQASTQPPLGRLHHRLALLVLLDLTLLKGRPPAPAAPLVISSHLPEPAHVPNAPQEDTKQLPEPQVAPIARRDFISRALPLPQAASHAMEANTHQLKKQLPV